MEGENELRQVCSKRGPAHAAGNTVREALASKRLVRVLGAFCVPFPGLFVYYPSRAQVAPKVQTMIDFFKLPVARGAPLSTESACPTCTRPAKPSAKSSEVAVRSGVERREKGSEVSGPSWGARGRLTDLPRGFAPDPLATLSDGFCLQRSTASIDRSEKLPVDARERLGHVWLVAPILETLTTLVARSNRARYILPDDGEIRRDARGRCVTAWSRVRERAE